MKTKHTKAAKKVKKLAQPKEAPVRSKAARAGIAEGTRLYALAGRPTKADFIKVYGPSGPKMTWAQPKAGDLAHGLKTPLAVLAQEADRAETAGQHEMASHQPAGGKNAQVD